VLGASRRNEPDATPLDVLRAVLESPGTLAGEAMHALGVDPAALAAKIPQDGEAASPLPLRQLLVNANREAQVLGHYQVDAIHLLLALLYSDARPTAAVLQSSGLTLYDLRRHMQAGSRPDAAVNPGARVTRSMDRAVRRRPWPSLRPVLGVSRIFIGLVAAMLVAGALLWFGLFPAGTGIFTLAFVVVGWVVSVCLHEFSHAAVGYLGGDRDVAASGYLTLNPLRYTNIVMSIVFPVVALLLGGIGLPGGAVYINPAALRTRAWDSLVSLAGPASNAVMALLVAALFNLGLRLGWITANNFAFFEALAFLGFLQVFALFLNLVPIPPLDGFGILRPWLPWSIRSAAARLGMFGYLIVFLLLFYVPPVSSAVLDTVSGLTNLLGIDPYFVALGAQHMRFR
jgi:Zn-dependent protease